MRNKQDLKSKTPHEEIVISNREISQEDKAYDNNDEPIQNRNCLI